MYKGSKFRNLRFVSHDDSGYLSHVEQSILRSMHLPRLVKTISKTERLSRILEKVVRSWVASVGGTDDRIISFEVFRHRSNDYRQHYRELDLVIDRGDHLVIGELKVSYSKKSRLKAHRQLQEVYQLVSRMDKPVHLLLIHINLLPNKKNPPLAEFETDFRKCRILQRTLYGDFVYGFLHLEADEIFEWGLQNGLIDKGDNRLVMEAKEEAGRSEWIKRMRRRFAEDGVPQEKWPSVLRNTYAKPDDTPDISYATGSKGNSIGPKLRQALRKK